MGRRFELVTVVLPWNGQAVFCRGELDGLPVFGWRGRPGAVPAGLCTRRQLRAEGLRPGGADPVALLVFGHRRPARSVEVCPLWLRETARAVRPMTPAKWSAHRAAMRARRFCRTCLAEVDHVVRGPLRQCSTCYQSDDATWSAA
ncbi:RRQRL motif-containing zinc-binding protein [Actinosynnema pretiosum]|uniref:RRQRL motif-containing zinc-binding protein n=1 Tax=Actinosynnema pretiosum TaxID=42197 RepID=UPI0015A6F03D|nr:RRQRL motif-containing zinc-binding protein [Actinosynnema pretiosum]